MSLPITAAQALAAAAIVATRAADHPHLRRLADALTALAEVLPQPCEGCPFKGCDTCVWQGSKPSVDGTMGASNEAAPAGATNTGEGLTNRLSRSRNG